MPRIRTPHPLAPILWAALVAILCGALSPASAQQDQSPRDADSGPEGTQGGGQAEVDAPDAPVDTRTVVQPSALTGPTFIAVIDFTVDPLAEFDPVDAVTEMGRSEHVARISTDPVGGLGTSGKLVFEDRADYEGWLAGEADAFFEPVGGMDVVTLDATVFRPDLLSVSDPEALLAGLETLSIRYVNTGNRSDGDADIDAVTVVCTGRGADCKPSN